ncbi:glycerol-3-phosphate 1-O-acyltransferase PlsY [Hellea balneolensis]|uniref:glycerol-3-phosphate 1-O-acyltransferase PlsY n=1 Tax=Hellea balneolensis TaxID=287478 RepID=UPI001F3F0EE4|nr:glycerol-3-phosphate 1-O-acyltransferase PlsY [Hellea balneolensis]
MSILYALLGGYLLGSIPFGLLITRATGQGDIRNIGSGNIGATNVLRTGRKDIALITLLLDAAKAGVAALIFNHFFGMPIGLFAGAAALIGHCFPVWLKFKGGKGVATFFGCLLATAWPLGLIAGGIWLACAFFTRISSLSALAAAGASPLIAFMMGYYHVAIMAAVLAVIIYIRHAENIGRIIKGTESRIGKKG